jgi:hypothetical protein
MVDKLMEGGMNLCCIKEENLYTSEHEPGHKWVRKCRVCGSRHIRMQCESIPISLTMPTPNMIRRRSSGARDIRMKAEPGSFGTVLRGTPAPPEDTSPGDVRYLDL